MEFIIVFSIIAVIGGAVYIAKYFIFKDYFEDDSVSDNEVEYFEKNVLKSTTIEKEDEDEKDD